MKLPHSTRNWITLVGVMIAVVALFMILFFFGISVFLGQGRPYLGLVTYILLPAVMILGLLLIPLGMFVQSRRDRKGGFAESAGWPRIDLNNPRHRNAFFIFSGGTALLLFLSAIGSYEAYHFTDSVVFCGELCHTVMEPEYTAYQHSPHARVACVSCHVGPGADWYVRSKLSGLYQIYAVMFNKYPRPIPTPIENLRPAREVCEQCHWPQKFYSQNIRFNTYYLPDKENTRWDLYLVLPIAAEQRALGLAEGIHWHINPDVRIEYIATDEGRLDLPWVRYTNLGTGRVTVFQAEDSPLDEARKNESEIRTMDCMDCHNRPSHDFRAPTAFINDAITAGEMPRELPYVKAEMLKICSKEYPSSDAAMQAIERTLGDYYKENYPDLYASRKELVNRAVAGLRQGFSRNIFPYMNARWSAYPNQIGHMYFTGCFRCHNDRHVSSDGKAISRDCTICHLINAQGNPENMQLAELNRSLEFRHPEEIGDIWKEMLCSDCHTGISP